MTIEQIAQVVHDIQRSFCISIGDNSLPTWRKADYQMQSTTMDGVKALILNPEAEAGFSHEEWMRNKLEQGWTLGDVKDWEKKTHPALIPFADLPVHEQTKDYLFVQTVRSLQGFYFKMLDDEYNVLF